MPVLSSRMTSTSPDASTARPLMARTLKRATRSMPAMPMADSSPPIVVGMRHTSRAISATVSTVVPAYWPNGRSVTVAIRKTMVSPASRMASAISLGVRWRLAPSTRAIIRSRKVSPGSVVTRTTMRSLTSVVPPVTELRMSVPGLLEDRRGLAGDRGLVDEPDALDDVAVTGDRLAFLDDDDVALAQLGRADVLERAVRAAAMRGRDRARPPQRGGLGATARLGDRLGIGREQDREPQPDRDLDREADATRAGRLDVQARPRWR